MIRVFADRCGDRYRLLVEGHAAHHKDADSVCAAVSALVQSLVRFAATTPSCRHLRYSVERGRVFLSCRAGLGSSFDMVLGGLAEISHAYPECLHVSVNDRQQGSMLQSHTMHTHENRHTKKGVLRDGASDATKE